MLASIRRLPDVAPNEKLVSDNGCPDLQVNPMHLGLKWHGARRLLRTTTSSDSLSS